MDKTGGVVGFNDDTGALVQNCVAVNYNIFVPSSSDYGRVAGDNTTTPLLNNYGWEGVNLNDSINTWASSNDGADVLTGAVCSEYWWRRTQYMGPPGPGFDFSPTGAWDWPAEKILPILKGFPAGIQNPQVMLY